MAPSRNSLMVLKRYNKFGIVKRLTISKNKGTKILKIRASLFYRAPPTSFTRRASWQVVNLQLEEGLEKDCYTREKGLQRGSREGTLLVVKFYVQFDQIIWIRLVTNKINILGW